MRKASLAGFVCCALAVGCASESFQPKPEEAALANYGVPPRANYKDEIKAIVSSDLKDPDSAEYRWVESEPRKAWRYQGLLHGGGHDYGWIVHVSVNAKNSFGAYVGYTPYAFWFKDGNSSLMGVFFWGYADEIGLKQGTHTGSQ